MTHISLISLILLVTNCLRFDLIESDGFLYSKVDLAKYQVSLQPPTILNLKYLIFCFGFLSFFVSHA